MSTKTIFETMNTESLATNIIEVHDELPNSFFESLYEDIFELDAFMDRICMSIETGVILSLGNQPTLETRMEVNSSNIDEISNVSATLYTWTKVIGNGYTSLFLYNSGKYGLVRIQHRGPTCMWRRIRDEELSWNE
jgi:hypothetical protein